ADDDRTADKDAAGTKSAPGGKDADKNRGVIVRYVYPDSPAAKAGIENGDKIISLNGEAVKDRAGLQGQNPALGPLDAAKLQIRRSGKTQPLEIKLATLPEAVPDKLPAAHEDKPTADAEPVATGKIEIKIPEAPSGALAYVPTTYNSHVPHGLII